MMTTPATFILLPATPFPALPASAPPAPPAIVAGAIFVAANVIRVTFAAAPVRRWMFGITDSLNPLNWAIVTLTLGAYVPPLIRVIPAANGSSTAVDLVLMSPVDPGISIAVTPAPSIASA